MVRIKCMARALLDCEHMEQAVTIRHDLILVACSRLGEFESVKILPAAL